MSAFAAFSGATLLIWYVTARPLLADLVRTLIPGPRPNGAVDVVALQTVSQIVPRNV